MSEDGLLMISVPYDEGWTVLVDGEEAEKLPVGEALTGCYLTAGSHRIEMRYIPQGFVPGAIISIVSVMLFIAGLLIKSGRFHKSR